MDVVAINRSREGLIFKFLLYRLDFDVIQTAGRPYQRACDQKSTQLVRRKESLAICVSRGTPV